LQENRVRFFVGNDFDFTAKHGRKFLGSPKSVKLNETNGYKWLRLRFLPVDHFLKKHKHENCCGKSRKRDTVHAMIYHS